MSGRSQRNQLPFIQEEPEEAKHNSMEVMIADNNKLGVKIHKGYFKPMEPKVKFEDFNEDTPVLCRKRRQNRVLLKLTDKLDIVHQVIVKHKMVVTVAKEYRVTQNTVRILVAKAKKKPKMMDELLCRQDMQQTKEEIILAVVNRLIESDAFIDSCAFVHKQVNQEHMIQPSAEDNGSTISRKLK
jgi:hypothetical protein